MRYLLITCLVLMAAACSQRVPHNVLLDYADTDLHSLPAAEYAKAVKALGQVTSGPVTVEENRNIGPQQIVSLADGSALLIERRPSAVSTTSMVASLVDSQGRLHWRQEMTLGAGSDFAELVPHTRTTLTARPLLIMPLTGENKRCKQLVWAVSSRGLLLVRAQDSHQQACLDVLFKEHPDMIMPGGTFTSKDLADNLAAMVALSNPREIAGRSDPKAVSYLKELAQASDLWVAETAAMVLILPRNE